MEYENVDQKFINDLIQEQGITVNKLCKLVGIAPAGMYRYLRGERELSNPGKAAIYYYSLVGVDIDSLKEEIKRDLINKIKEP